MKPNSILFSVLLFVSCSKSPDLPKDTLVDPGEQESLA